MRTADPPATQAGGRTAEPEAPPGLPAARSWPVASISVGLRAHRRGGDLTALAGHITSHGLLHPPSVTPAGRLVTGARRLAAVRLAGLTEVPARTITTVEEALQVLAWEACRDGELGLPREPWTVAEAAWLDAAIRDLEWWPRAGPGHGSTGHDHRLALVAAADGPGGRPFWNQHQYSLVRRLWLAAQGLQADSSHRLMSPSPDGAREAALDALAVLDTTDTSIIQPTCRAWRARVYPSSRPQFGAAAVPGLLAGMKGATTAISSAGMPGPDVTPADLEAIQAEATRLIRATSQFRRGICQ